MPPFYCCTFWSGMNFHRSLVCSVANVYQLQLWIIHRIEDLCARGGLFRKGRDWLNFKQLSLVHSQQLCLHRTHFSVDHVNQRYYSYSCCGWVDVWRKVLIIIIIYLWLWRLCIQSHYASHSSLKYCIITNEHMWVRWCTFNSLAFM